MRAKYYLFAISLSTVVAMAADNASATNNKSIQKNTVDETIEVKGVRLRLIESGALKDSEIAKTEVISNEQISNSQSANLTEAIQNAIGIRVSNECSICGVKRVMINGLKGEHTNVLIDGVPLHTMLSGFYGLDSVAASGIGSIEVARGAGASLTTPEAIGGTVNLITHQATKNGLELDISAGELGYKKMSVMATAVNDQQDTTATVISQYDHRDQFDGDNNGVSETPALTNQSLTVYLSHDLSYHDNIRFRFNQVRSEVFGGPVLGDTTASVADALSSVYKGEAEQLFVDGDVRNRFIGNPWETAEWVKTERSEYSASWLHDFDGKLSLTANTAYVEHQQDSFYEAIDYIADNKMLYTSVRFNYDVNDDHLLVFGTDIRNESMRSESSALVDLPDYVADSFDYRVTGIFVQDTWTPSEKFELAGVLRLDKLHADFVDPAKPGVEIAKTIVSPRVDMRYLHTDEITSRLSVGQGYRAPLSFFESDHGILDAGLGYKIEVDQPERSNSVTYSLNYQASGINSTFSAAYTEVKHLAALEADEQGVPILTQLNDKAAVTALDWQINYQLFSTTTLGFVAETYIYDDTFKSSFPIAPVEQRLSLTTNWQQFPWQVNASVNWVGSRDLTEYGYEGFNRNDGSAAKRSEAPSYFTVDVKVERQLSNNLSFYLGALNLTDYSQSTDADSPQMFDAEGGYDVVYIYGPLRGRTLYLGFDYDF